MKPAPGDVLVEKYKLKRLVGAGGSGQVFLAEHLVTGRAVAVKLVLATDAVTRERLLREARSMGQVAHPNVVGVLDMGEWGDAVFLVMEYIHGKSLRELTKGRVVPVSEAIRLLLPACSGVAAAHQAGILHRDLKPENLFVCTDGDGIAFDTKVLDFGGAKMLDGAGDDSLTDDGTVVGTPRYMAPEQFDEELTLDERTDVYALALVLYEMLAGRLPYATTNLRSIMVEILKGNFQALRHLQPGIPAELSEVVMRALSPEVDDRYPDVASFAGALEPWSGGQSFIPPRDVHTRGTAKDSWLPASASESENRIEKTVSPSLVLADTDAVEDPPGAETSSVSSGITRPSQSDQSEGGETTYSSLSATPEGVAVGGRPLAAVRYWPWAMASAVLLSAIGWRAWRAPEQTEVPSQVPALASSNTAELPAPVPSAQTEEQPTTDPEEEPAAAPEEVPASSDVVSDPAPEPSAVVPPPAQPKLHKPRAKKKKPRRVFAPPPKPAKVRRAGHATDNRDPWAQ